MNKLNRHRSGFTLLETVIYIALLGLILTGAVATSYLLVANSGKIDASNSTSQEGSFVMQKLSWALSGANAILIPNQWGNVLTLTWYDGTTIAMRLNANAIEMSENGSEYATLTSSSTHASTLSFHYIPAVNNMPVGLEASTTINNQVFFFKRYLRQ